MQIRAIAFVLGAALLTGNALAACGGGPLPAPPATQEASPRPAIIVYGAPT